MITFFFMLFLYNNYTTNSPRFAILKLLQLHNTVCAIVFVQSIQKEKL